MHIHATGTLRSIVIELWTYCSSIFESNIGVKFEIDQSWEWKGWSSYFPPLLRLIRADGSLDGGGRGSPPVRMPLLTWAVSGRRRCRGSVMDQAAGMRLASTPNTVVMNAGSTWLSGLYNVAKCNLGKVTSRPAGQGSAIWGTSHANRACIVTHANHHGSILQACQLLLPPSPLSLCSLPLPTGFPVWWVPCCWVVTGLPWIPQQWVGKKY